jgi:hypothetical protein
MKEDWDMMAVASLAIGRDMAGDMVKVEVDFGIVDSIRSVMIRAPPPSVNKQQYLEER